jgi:hypothetical protein
MLQLDVAPGLALAKVEDGKRGQALSDRVGIDHGPLLLISIAGEPDTVGLLGRPDHLTVTAFGQRSNVQYALSAATAIALARELGGQIWDDRRFFGTETHTSPEILLKRLRVSEPHHDYREAAERIQWGPNGPSSESSFPDG